jgi:hypothetical protein
LESSSLFLRGFHVIPVRYTGSGKQVVINGESGHKEVVAKTQEAANVEQEASCVITRETERLNLNMEMKLVSSHAPPRLEVPAREKSGSE